jgi:cytochrome P450
MTTAQERALSDLSYDPYDLAIDKDPYPVWKRMRDEAPLYYNDKHDFYALSRYQDVREASYDWRTYISGKGSVLELIKSGVEIPPGTILFEDPPAHDAHRGLLARVFTPRRIADIEPKVREFCVKTLDPLVGSPGFDLIGELGSVVPMRTIGMMLGIPEADQDALRESIDEGMKLSEDGTATQGNGLDMLSTPAFAEYVEWRESNPSDDLMSALLTAEYEDEDGRTRRLDREAVLSYVALLAAAGAETTTRLIGWSGKLLAEHPDQRRQLHEDLSLLPKAIEEVLRFEAPSPVQARFVTRDVEHYGGRVPEGSVMLLVTGSANRDDREFTDPDLFDIHREGSAHVSFGYGIHNCLGAALARLEARVALEELLTRWPTWEIDWDNARQAHTATVRGWEALPLLVS